MPFKNDELKKTIYIDESRKTYSSIKNNNDTTFIEIIDKGNIEYQYFFEIDENIFNKSSLLDNYKNKSIYILNYQKGFEINISLGLIEKLMKVKFITFVKY